MRKYRWLIAAAALILLIVITHGIWLSALGRYLIDSVPPARADAILVLGGDFKGHRILSAAELVRRGYAPRVIVSGPAGFYGGHECDYAIQYAVQEGYPESYFVPAPNSATSTEQEARDMLPELRRLGVRRLDIVTDNFHTRRAGRVYRLQAPDLEIHAVAATDDNSFQPDNWWRHREARKTFLMEWTKTIANWLGI